MNDETAAEALAKVAEAWRKAEMDLRSARVAEARALKRFRSMSRKFWFLWNSFPKP